MNRSLALLVVLALGLAVALRWPQLDVRPMHNDEAVNAIKFGELLEKGAYRYDPNEHHGPSLYYATLALSRLTGAPPFADYSEARLRALPVLFGLGLLLLLPLVTDALGRNGIVWAALFTAVSPSLVFYSRYYIHEMPLVFFTFLTLAAGWRYWRSRKLGWALLAGAGLGLMHATKETFVLTLAAAGLALCLNQVWNRLLDASGLPVKAPPLKFWHLAAALGAWLAVALLLFSSFFTNPHGLADSLRTYAPWLSRAGGDSPHLHPWHFYLHRLLFFHAPGGPLWTEGLLLVLAVVGGIAGFRRRWLGRANASFVRFLAWYVFLLTAFYSLLAYKTPWCLLSFWHATILLAGVGAAVLVRSARVRLPRFAVPLLLLAGVAHLGWQAWRAAVPYAADRRNPYVYAQSSPEVVELAAQIEALAQVHPLARQMPVQVMAPEGDYWPLPWYLRRFAHVGWWDHVPAEPFAPLMIASPKLHARFDDQKTHQMVRIYALRPEVFLELYVQTDLWKDWLSRAPAR